MTDPWWWQADDMQTALRLLWAGLYRERWWWLADAALLSPLVLLVWCAAIELGNEEQGLQEAKEKL